MLKSKIIYIGDHCQLPPVNEKSSIVFDNVKNVIKLNTIIRANNEDIKSVNRRFRRILTDKKLLSIKDSWYSKKSNVIFVEERSRFHRMINRYMTNESKILCYTNKAVVEYNILARNLLFGENVAKFMNGEKICFNSHFVSNETKYYSNQEVLVNSVSVEKKPHQNGCVYKVYKLQVGNDTLYRIHEHSEREYLAYFSKKYNQLKVNPNTNSGDWERFYDRKYSFYPPIDYAYSTTIHKAQGSTHKLVFVDMNDISGVAYSHKDVDLEKVLYTAISRASDKLICYY